MLSAIVSTGAPTDGWFPQDGLLGWSGLAGRVIRNAQLWIARRAFAGPLPAAAATAAEPEVAKKGKPEDAAKAADAKKPAAKK